MNVTAGLAVSGASGSGPGSGPERAADRNSGQLPAAALGRIAPFRPAGRLPPIFVLAIPRCGAGSALRFLERIYGADGVIRQAEGRLDGIFRGREPAQASDCVAGSLPLVRWLHFAGVEAYARVTVLRNPWARMVSQINHLATMQPDEAAAGGASMAALVHEVRLADFTSKAGLERFFNRLRLIDGGFDNLQVRMLLSGTMSAMVKHITPRDVDLAFQQLQRFAVVGFCEEQLELQRALAQFAGVKVAVGAIFEGAGRNPVLSARNTLAREMLAPLYELDADLYARARAMFGVRPA